MRLSPRHLAVLAAALCIGSAATAQTAAKFGRYVGMPGERAVKGKIIVIRNGKPKVVAVVSEPEFTFDPIPCSASTYFKAVPINPRYRESLKVECTIKVRLESHWDP